MNGRNTIPRGTGATTAADSLSIHKHITSELFARLSLQAPIHLNSVHCSLAGCAVLEGLENHVCEPTASGGVARVDCGARRRGDDGTFGDSDVDRGKAALIEWNILVDDTSEHIDDCRACETWRCIVIALALRHGSVKIEDGIATLCVDGDLEMDLCAVIELIYSRQRLWMELANLFEVITDSILCVLLYGQHVGLNCFSAIFPEEILNQRATSLVGSYLRF